MVPLIWMWACMVLSLVLPCTSLVKLTDSVTPMEKVIELLDVLRKEIKVDNDEDEEAYARSDTFYQKEAQHSDETVDVNRDKMAQLQEDIKEADALRDKKKLELQEVLNVLAEDERHLTEGRAQRKKKRDSFEEDLAAYDKAIDQLTRSLDVMAKKDPAQAASFIAKPSPKVSMLAVAENLRRSLTRSGSVITLTTMQRETLDRFVRDASAWYDQPAPSFLQQGTKQTPEALGIV